MSTIPEKLKFAKSHEWVRVEENGDLTIGISDYAQSLLGDLVYIELPESGNAYQPGEDMAVVESVKAASDIYCPVAGEVIAVNEALENEPELVNSDPYGKGWLLRIKPEGEEGLAELLDAKTYAAQVAADTH